MNSLLPEDSPQSLVTFNITFYLMGVPSSAAELGTYMDSFLYAIRTVLSMSQDWQIQVAKGLGQTRSLTSAATVNLEFISWSVSLIEGQAMELKARDPSTIQKLNKMGFNVSSTRFQVQSDLQSIVEKQENITAAFSSQGPSVITIAVCSAAGAVVCIVVGISYSYCVKTNIESSFEDTTKQGFAQTNQDMNSVNRNGKCSEEPNISYTSKLETKEDDLKDHLSSEVQSESNASTAVYSRSIDDIMQIMARAGIGIDHFVNLILKKQLKAKMMGPNSLSWYDCSAILQMIAFTEIDKVTFPGGEHVEIPEIRTAIARSAQDGPLTENHLQMLRIICRPDTCFGPGGMAEKGGRIENVRKMNRMHQAKFSAPENTESSHIGGSVTDDKMLEENESDLNSMMLSLTRLLHKFELQPSYLLHKECRELIELNLIKREDGLTSDQQAILQMVSKAEINSDVWPLLSPERKALLEERVNQGPLSSRHLNAVSSLEAYDMQGDIAISVNDQPQPDCESLASVSDLPQSERAISNSLLTSTEPQGTSQPDHYKLDCMPPASLQGVTAESGLSGRIEAKDVSALPIEGSAPFFDTNISGLEVTSSLLSRHEKARIQQVELKIKTDRIRRSIPEWVRQGLLPPLQFHSLKAAGGRSSPVLISSSVRADLGFIGVMEAPKPPKSLFLYDSEPTTELISEQRLAFVTSTGPVSGEQVEVELQTEAELRQSGGRQAGEYTSSFARFIRHVHRFFWSILARCCGWAKEWRGAPHTA
jgi:hypothetical protein